MFKKMRTKQYKFSRIKQAYKRKNNKVNLKRKTGKQQHYIQISKDLTRPSHRITRGHYELKKLKLYYYFFELLKPFLACIINWKSSSKTVRMKDTKTKVE